MMGPSTDFMPCDDLIITTNTEHVPPLLSNVELFTVEESNDLVILDMDMCL